MHKNWLIKQSFKLQQLLHSGHWPYFKEQAFVLVHDSCSWAGVAEVTTRPPTGLLCGFSQALLSQTEKKLPLHILFTKSSAYVLWNVSWCLVLMFSLFSSDKIIYFVSRRAKALFSNCVYLTWEFILNAVLLRLHKFKPGVVYDRLKVYLKFVYMGELHIISPGHNPRA